MNKENNDVTMEGWKDLELQISKLLDLTWKHAEYNAEAKVADVRHWYIENMELIVESGDTYTELDDELKRISKDLKPPVTKHIIWKTIKSYIKNKLRKTYEQTFKDKRKEGFDRVAKILLYLEKLGLPEEAKHLAPEWLKKVKEQ